MILAALGGIGAADVGMPLDFMRVLRGGGDYVGEGDIQRIAFAVLLVVAEFIEVDAGASGGGEGDSAAGIVRDAVASYGWHEVIAGFGVIAGDVESLASARQAMGRINVGADEVEVVGGAEIGLDVGGVAGVLVGFDDEMEVLLELVGLVA